MWTAVLGKSQLNCSILSVIYIFRLPYVLDYLRPDRMYVKTRVLLVNCFAIFKDVNLTWYTRNGQTPDFTRCFELTVLAWIPCAFLWIFGAISLYGIWTTHSKYIPWNALNVTKCISSIILAILQLILLFNHAFYAQEFYTVEIVTPCIRIATFVSFQDFLNYFYFQL